MQQSLDLIFSALANPTRRTILDRLCSGDASVGDLAAPFALSQPTICTNLKILEPAGLVARSRQASLRPVHLQPAGLAAIEGGIGLYRDLWDPRLDLLEILANELQQKDTPQGRRPYPVTYCTADFRVGGAWRMHMTGPDRVPDRFFGGTYLEINPHSRIVSTNGFEDGATGMDLSTDDEQMVMTTTFDEAGGKTNVTVSIQFASAAMKEEFLGIGMLEGLSSGLDQLQVVADDLAHAG